MAISNFVPEIWSGNILANLHDSLIYAGLCNRDYEGDIAEAGDTVHITSFGAISTRTYTKYTDITFDQLSDDTRALIVDQQDYFAFSVDDVDKRQALGGFIEKEAAEAAYSLAQDTDTYVSGLMVAATDQTSNDLGALVFDISDSTGYGHIVDMRTKLNRNKIPARGRWLAVPPEVYAALLQDNRFIKANEAGTTEGLREGFVGRIAGFDVYESNTVPEPTSGTYHVIAGHSMAITFADQILKTVAVSHEKQFGDGIKGLHVYGAKVVRPEALVLASVTVQA